MAIVLVPTVATYHTGHGEANGDVSQTWPPLPSMAGGNTHQIETHLCKARGGHLRDYDPREVVTALGSETEELRREERKKECSRQRTWHGQKPRAGRK